MSKEPKVGSVAGNQFVDDIKKLTKGNVDKELCLAWIANRVISIMLEIDISTNMMVKFLELLTTMLKKSVGYIPEE